MVISYFSTYYKNQHFPAVGSNVIAIAKRSGLDFLFFFLTTSILNSIEPISDPFYQ